MYILPFAHAHQATVVEGLYNAFDRLLESLKVLLPWMIPLLLLRVVPPLVPIGLTCPWDGE